jgi:NAD(P)-dependent dehydrogenase (short-subunit alcohol dehydrogenase family)
MFLGPASTDQGVRFTSDGLELSYAVNYLANYLLITLLLPILSPTSARIIFIGSTSHNPAYASNAGAYHKPEMKIMFHDDFEALARGKVKIEKGDEFPASVRRYGGSKLCMTMLMYSYLPLFSSLPKF